MLLNYAEFGPESETDETLIILHGLFGSIRNWQSIARRLSHDFRVITVDQRNHGDSPHVSDMNYQLMADDIERLMQSLEIDNAHIMGHSMGGKISMVLSLIYPELVKSLTVVDIAPVPYQHGFEALVAALQKMPVGEIKTRGEADKWLSSKIPTPSLRHFLLQNLSKQGDFFDWRVNLSVISECIGKLSDFPAQSGDMSFDGPSLFIGGADSVYIREEHKPAIKALFPDHELFYVEGAGHWPHVENPSGFFEHLDVFLAKHRA